MVKKLGVFLAGGAVGAAIAYFTCPRSGFENRNLAKDAVSAVLETAGAGTTDVANQATQAAQNVAAQGQEFVKQAAEKTHEFYATASTKVQEFASGVGTGVATAADNDELRKKIEAARQRIAAQVVKNAEEAQLVDVEPAPVEAVVEEASAAVAEAVAEPAAKTEE